LSIRIESNGVCQKVPGLASLIKRWIRDKFAGVKTFFPISAVGAVAGLMALAANLDAVEKNPATPEAVVAPAQSEGLAVAVSLVPGSGPLEDAYSLLRTADHDYKGHRAKAMRQIAVAGRLLGMKIGGRGSAGENQGTSDAQLRQALSILNGATGNLAGKPLLHVQKAINELNIALSIR
jgi:hypothetical protein